jgi:HSP20 family molecular chaperone IbpA
MATIAVEKVKEDGSKSPAFVDKIEKIGEQIRRRAHEIFQHRGADASATEDWLKAENELFPNPASELIEKGGNYEISIAAAGFKPGDIKVSALPDSLVVSGESTHSHEKNENNVHFCEFGQKSFFRQFPLPEKINADKVTANLTDGILHVTAQKADGAAKTIKAAA